MVSSWMASAIALLCLLVSTPIVLALCRRWNLYDSNGSLNIHVGPIPRLGGAGMALGLIIALLVVEPRAMNPHLFWWLAAFALIWLAGFIDDMRGLSPVLKLGAQIGAGALLSLAGWNSPIPVSRVVGAAFICGIVVLFTNAFNFLDGCDGLAVGVTAVIASAYVCAHGAGTKGPGAIVAWSLLGASAGFLVYNFPPAKIFMGDSGSTILGFCVAFLGIDFVSNPPLPLGSTRWIFPILVAAVPIADGIAVVFRRIARGTSVFQGDRRHYYDCLLARGWKSGAVALASYAATLFLAAIGLATVGRRGATLTAFLIAGAIAATLAGIDRFRARLPGKQRSNAHAGGEFLASK